MMVKIVIYLLLSWFGTHNLFTQTYADKALIKEINSMYVQTEEYINSAKNCKTAEKINRKSEYEGGELYEYPQKAKHCIFHNELSVFKGELSGWEWDETITLYQKSNAIYFAFIVSNDVSATSELRAYLNRNGKIILLLERTFIEPDQTGIDKEITDPERIQEIEKYIQSKHHEITSMLY